MKKTIVISIAIVLLNVMVSPVTAGQYGDTIEQGEVLGTTTEVVHEPVESGVSDWELWWIVLATGLLAVVSNVLYRVTYKLYIFDR